MQRFTICSIWAAILPGLNAIEILGKVRLGGGQKLWPDDEQLDPIYSEK
jgi:hypothetical protein